MSRQKRNTTPTNFRFPSDLLAEIDRRVGKDGAAKDRTAYLVDLVRKDIETAVDERLYLEPDSKEIIDKVRKNSIPPTSRSAVINWLIVEYLSEKIS